MTYADIAGLAKRTRDALGYYCRALGIDRERHGNHAARGHWASQMYEKGVREGRVRPLPICELTSDERQWLRHHVAQPLGHRRLEVLKSYVVGL